MSSVLSLVPVCLSNHLEIPLLALLPMSLWYDGSECLSDTGEPGANLNSSSLLVTLLLLTETFVCPASISARSTGLDARDFERRDQFGKDDVGVRREVKRLSEEVKAGKMSRVMVLMDGAQATKMARWFSRTAKIITIEKRTSPVSCWAFRYDQRNLQVKSRFTANMWTAHIRAALAARTL